MLAPSYQVLPTACFNSRVTRDSKSLEAYTGMGINLLLSGDAGWKTLGLCLDVYFQFHLPYFMPNQFNVFNNVTLQYTVLFFLRDSIVAIFFFCFSGLGTQSDSRCTIYSSVLQSLSDIYTLVLRSDLQLAIFCFLVMMTIVWSFPFFLFYSLVA